MMEFSPRLTYTPLTFRTTATGGEQSIDGMVQQLRELICQFEWSQTHVKEMQKRVGGLR